MLLPKPLPDHLYHYTDVGGLFGILGERQLRATHVGYLNDSTEFHLGMGLITARINEMPVELHTAPSSRTFVTTIIKAVLPLGIKQAFKMQFEAFSQRAGIEAGPFVACLSGSRNQLSQWRGYGVRGGYAIQFDAEVLAQHLRDNTPEHEEVTEGFFALPIRNRELGKVGYKLDDAIPAIDQQLASSAQLYQDFMSELFEKQEMPERFDLDMQKLIGPGIADLLRLAARLKHDGFREEREFRIVTFSPPEKFTPSNTGLKPCINVMFPACCIREIMVGPGANMEQREASVRIYLKHLGSDFNHVQVSRSNIPFTGL